MLVRSKTFHVLFRVTMSFAALICLCATNVQAQTSSSVHNGIIYRNPRVYNIEYSFEMFPDPNKIDRSKDLKLWIPIPREWDSQKVVKIISVEPQTHAKYVDPEYGNPMLFWDFSNEPEQSSYRVEIKYRLEQYEVYADVDPNRIGPYEKTSKDYILYTQSTHTILITDKVKELAKTAVGDEKDPYLQAKRIYEYVEEKMRFRGEFAGFRRERGSSIKTMLEFPVTDQKTGKDYYEGKCYDYSKFFVALCRAVGIPARVVLVFKRQYPRPYWTRTGLSPEGLAADDFFGVFGHAWAEFYLPNYGWIPADPQKGAFGRSHNDVVIVSKGTDIKIGPDAPQKENQGYGIGWVGLHSGRADSIWPDVRNIARFQRAEVKVFYQPDPFPADALTQYTTKLYPEAEAEKNLALYRKRTLRWIDENVQAHADKITALAQACKNDPKVRYEHEAFICHMLRKIVGDKKFSDIFETYTNLRVKSGKPVSTARFQKIAEDIYGQPLEWFFKQWVGYIELPQLHLDAVMFSEDARGWQVCGNLRQLNNSLFRLPVEFVLETEKTTEYKKLWLENRNTEFEFRTTNRPNSVLVDPNNDILQIREMPPLIDEHSSYDEVASQIITDQDKADWYNWTPLHFAAQAGQADIVEFLIAKGADVNAKNRRGETPLDIAVSRRRKEVVKLLIAKGATISTIYLAAYVGDLVKVKTFIQEGIDVSTEDASGYTALHYATDGGYRNIAELLIERGADVNAKNMFGDTPIHLAIRAGRRDIIELLIANSSNVNVKNNDGQAPIDVAFQQKRENIVELLSEEGATISTIHLAVFIGDLAKVKAFIQEGVDANTKMNGWTPLHYAAQEGHKEIVELLLAHGADVNIGAHYNLTAADLAMGRNHNEIVELLISKGADISPLHIALNMKDEAKARSLIESGADVNKRTPYGTTPLSRAVNAGFKDVVELLIAKGANVNAKDNWDWTPLHSATEEGHRELVELLIARGANVNAKDGAGRTPLWYAEKEGHTEIVKLLKKHGAKE